MEMAMPGEAAPLPRPINGVGGPLPPQGSNPMPNSQTPGHPSFRRFVEVSRIASRRNQDD
jgi:hypothetical protein